MRCLSKRDGAVSHVIGYVLSLSILSFVVVSVCLVTTTLVQEKTGDAAELYAENLANRVADAIINVCLMKEQYPDAKYSITLEIPPKLINYYDYYVEVNNHAIYVNTTDGKIHVSKTNYNVSQKLYMDIAGRVDGSQNKLTISCNKSDYIYKFDFGTNSSPVVAGYTRITDNCTSGNWPMSNWIYRTPITIYNPTSNNLQYYQILLQLNDNNFDHSLANSNASDLRFLAGGQELPYWIERWYPQDTHTSRIWVNVSTLPRGHSKIFMYYGNPSAAPHSSGEKTFLFFDDFKENTLNTTRWIAYQPIGTEIYTSDGVLVLTNGSAVISSGSKGYYLKPTSSVPCIIETKAKAVSREASMFARYSGGTPPYYYSYVFSSRSDLTFPLTLIYYKSGYWQNLTSFEKPLVNSEWNRLKYILNSTDNVVCRYFYSSFSVDGYGAVSHTDYKNGYFGLCTTRGSTTAYYDWVFVRKFAIKTNLVGGEHGDAEPVAYVGEVQSRNFNWSNYNPTTLKSGLDGNSATEVGKDFVYDNLNSATFYFKNLTLGKKYSLTFTGGNKTMLVQNMMIGILGGDKLGVQQPSISKSISFTSNQPYKKIWYSGIYPYTDPPSTTRGSIKITFSSSNPYHWAVCELTLEKGERIIKMTGGGP